MNYAHIILLLQATRTLYIVYINFAFAIIVMFFAGLLCMYNVMHDIVCVYFSFMSTYQYTNIFFLMT